TAALRADRFPSACACGRRYTDCSQLRSLFHHDEELGLSSCCQLADTEALPSLKELLSAVPNAEERTWDLLSWILSSKTFTIQSIKKQEYEKIQELTGMSGAAVPAPDFLFEVAYCDQMNAKFAETRGEQDLIYAFHGSRLENFHSILHNGLHCHLNRTSLFGEGTYLTSDLSLALLYSPHSLGWQRSTLGSILSCVAVCEIIDHPDVKCQSSWFSTHRFAITMMLYLLLLIVIGASNSPAFLYYWHRMFHSEG
uniref:Poly [ADP-ribose] polymerase n=1 Tax=Meleagris gallopavo TaxID=9103 RepID=A0A803Y7I4_MELGA